jgi:hypothetical protein
MNPQVAQAVPGQAANRLLLLPYALPYLIYVGIASLLGGRVSAEASYLLRLVCVPLALAWGWKWYSGVRGPRSGWGSVGVGAAWGVVGAVVWVALLRPFAPAPAEAWSGAAFALRLAAAGLLVPVFEELLMRGFVLRLAYQWDVLRRSGASQPLARALDDHSVDEVPPGGWTPAAVAVSTLAFAAGHQVYEWPAAVAYGTLMAGLWIRRKDLLSCMTAHGVTNALLAAYVWATGAWELW